ncbi:conserved hypothetical protein [Paraburkholderia caribensis]|nr:conserved hypothetical protein [Paraburkholderia caribensis]
MSGTANVSERIVAMLEDSENIMVERIAIAMALEEMPEVADMIMGEAELKKGGRTRAVVLSGDGMGLFFEGGELRSALLPGAWLSSPPSAILDKAPWEIKNKLHDLLIESGFQERSQRVISRVLTEADTLTRVVFKRLFRWRHVIATSAYTWGTGMSAYLDSQRSSMQRAAKLKSSRQLAVVSDYHSAVNAMRSMLSLASTSTDAPWLSEISTFPNLATWTPSSSMTRERLMLPAIQGAVAATWFSIEAVDLYQRRMDVALTQLSVLDAALGLTAFAVRFPDRANEILERAINSLNRLGHISDSLAFSESIRRSMESAVNAPMQCVEFIASWQDGVDGGHPASPVSRESEIAARFVKILSREHLDSALLVNGYFLAIIGIRLFSADDPWMFYPEPNALRLPRDFASERQALLRSGDGSIKVSFEDGATRH